MRQNGQGETVECKRYKREREIVLGWFMTRTGRDWLFTSDEVVEELIEAEESFNEGDGGNLQHNNTLLSNFRTPGENITTSTTTTDIPSIAQQSTTTTLQTPAQSTNSGPPCMLLSQINPDST